MEKKWSLSIAVKGLFVSASLSAIFGVANASAYTVTFNSTFGEFDGGATTNVVEYNDNHEVVNGEYKEPVYNNGTDSSNFITWYSEYDAKNRVNLDEISSDTTVYAAYEKITWRWDYTGDEQTFSLPITAGLQLHVWGAQGGTIPGPLSINDGTATIDELSGGYGGYSTGLFNFNANENIYINVGGQGGLNRGRNTISEGGYNGGGTGGIGNGGHLTNARSTGGGGATHIATKSGVLSTLKDSVDNIAIVAGGGGGKYYFRNDVYWAGEHLGNGGGFKGGYAMRYGYKANGAFWSESGILGATQTSAVGGGSFGQGANAPSNYGEQGGGGGGLYGGGASFYSAAGGSGYIGNAVGTTRHMAIFAGPTLPGMSANYSQSALVSDEDQTKTILTENADDDPIEDYAKLGNGYAKAELTRLNIRYINEFDGTDFTKDQYVGSLAQEFEITQRPGYTAAWYKGNDVWNFDDLVNFDTTLEVKYTPIVYSISYELGIGTLSEPNPSTYTIESSDITLNNPGKDYYTFLGWSGTGLTGDRNLTVTIPKGSIGNREYTANIAPTPYTIAYNLDGGANGANNPTEYNYESNEIVLARPTKEGYTFTGWSGTGIDGEDNLDVTIPTQSHGDREYTAHWSINQYTATFDVNGGAAIDPTTITSDYGLAFGTLPTTSRTGYDFDGWFTEQTGGTEISDTTTMPAEDHTYYAHWTIQTFNITYDLNGGELAQGASNPDTYTYESADINLAKPSREGYTFLGWSGTDLTDNIEDVTIAHNSLGDRSYRAEFQINEYTAIFDANAGETANPETITKNYDEELGDLPTTSRLGYAFLGWFADATAGDEITDATKMPAGNITYYAHWEIITYTIEYDLGGEDMDTLPDNDSSNPTSYTVNDSNITLKAATPGDTWHYFVGWALDRDSEDGLTDNFVIDTTEAKNIKVYAIFQANPYTVTIDPVNGEAETTRTVRGDQEIGELPTPTKDGYDFLGWFYGDKQVDEHFHPRSDARIVAHWEEIPMVPNTGVNSMPNAGDAILDNVMAFAVGVFVLFVLSLRTRKAEREI